MCASNLMTSCVMPGRDVYIEPHDCANRVDSGIAGMETAWPLPHSPSGCAMKSLDSGVRRNDVVPGSDVCVMNSCVMPGRDVYIEPHDCTNRVDSGIAGMETAWPLPHSHSGLRPESR
jgi:hypothetical protein